MESSAENEASQRPAQSGDDGGAGGDTAPSSIHNNTQDDDDVVVVVPRRPTDEKKVVTQEERRRDDVMIPEDSRVLSVSMYVGFPPKESNFVEIQREVALPSLPIKRIKPVYKSVGLGVIPKDDEYQWPSVSKRPRLGRNRTGETLGNDEADNASPQYARRRTRQNPNYEDETLSEPDWRDKGGNTRSTSRVGARYQVDALPKAGTAEYDNSNNTEMGDVLWDAVAANRARTTVGNLDAFLGKNRQLPVKMLLMQALHDVGYDTSRATQVFVQLVHSDRTRAELVLSEIQTYELHDIFRNQVEKDFNSIAHATGHSMDTVLVEYYKWKGSRRREHQRIKKTRRSSASNDYCEICNDGGSLILCELCRKAFHIECLDPPLEKVPDDLWYCDNCKIRSPARVRSLHHVASPGSEKSERKGVTRSPPDANSVIHGVTNARELPPRDPNGYYLAEIRNDPRLYISIGFDTTDHQLVFTGYQRSENGKMGQAELKNAFETPGDAICAVNGTRITGLGWRGASAVIDEAKRKSSRLIFLMKRRPQIVMPPRSSTIIATPLGPSVEPASTSNRAIVPSPQGKTETRVCAVANIPNSDAMNASQLAPGRASNDPVATVPSGTTNGSSIGRPQTAVDASKDPTIQLMAASNRANNNVGTTAESYDAVANMAARNRPNSDAARMAGSLPAAVNAAPNGFNSDSVRMAGLQPAMANTAAPNHLYNNGVRATESWPSVANTVVPNQPHKLSSGASNVNLANSSNIGVGGVVGSLPGLANMTAPNGINSDGARASTMQGALSRSSNGETASVANDSVKLNHQPTGFTQGVMRGTMLWFLLIFICFSLTSDIFLHYQLQVGISPLRVTRCHSFTHTMDSQGKYYPEAYHIHRGWR